MLRLRKPSADETLTLLTSHNDVLPDSPHVLSLTDGLLANVPKGFVHDRSRSEVGRGQRAFAAAREAFLRWEQFDLGWVQVANADAKIAPGQLVAVQAHTVFVWSINLSRITDVVETATRFGFMYTTTGIHVEEGEERFVLDLDPETESVSYLIEAVSRPRHPLARIAYPFSRAMQHRFARDSHARMKR